MFYQIFMRIFQDLYNYYIDMINLYKDDLNKINKLIEDYIKDNGFSSELNLIQVIMVIKVFLEFNHTIKTSTIINKVCKLLNFKTELIEYMNDSLEIGSEIYNNSMKYRFIVTELFKTNIETNTETNIETNTETNIESIKLKRFEFKYIFLYFYNLVFDIFEQMYDYSYTITFF